MPNEVGAVSEVSPGEDRGLEALLVPDVSSALDPASLINNAEDGEEVTIEFVPGPDNILLPADILNIPPLPTLVQDRNAEEEAVRAEYEAEMNWVLASDISGGASRTPYNTLLELSVTMPDFPEPVPAVTRAGCGNPPPGPRLSESSGAASDEDMFASIFSENANDEAAPLLTSTHNTQQVGNLLAQAAAKLPGYLRSVEKQMLYVVSCKIPISDYNLLV